MRIHLGIMRIGHNERLVNLWKVIITGDAAILVAIAINRLVSYLFPLHDLWRHPFHTKLAIILQWCYAGSMGLFYIHPDLHGTYSFIATTGAMSMSYKVTKLFQLRTIIEIVIGCLAGLTLAILYSICVAYLVYRKVVINTGQESQSLTVEARLTIQGFLLSSTLIAIEMLHGYVAFNRHNVPAYFVALLFMAHSSNFFCGPFIAMAMSTPVRKHIKKLFTSNNNVVHVIPGNALTNN